MMQEIKALDSNETYEVRYDAGYGDNAYATILNMTAESIHLEISTSTGRGDEEMESFESVRIVNEDDEIMAILNVEFVYDEE